MDRPDRPRKVRDKRVKGLCQRVALRHKNIVIAWYSRKGKNGVRSRTKAAFCAVSLDGATHLAASRHAKARRIFMHLRSRRGADLKG